MPWNCKHTLYPLIIISIFHSLFNLKTWREVLNLSLSHSVPSNFSLCAAPLSLSTDPPTPYLPPSITLDVLVHILPVRWMNPLSLDPLRSGASHATCNNPIGSVRTHRCTPCASHAPVGIYTSHRHHALRLSQLEHASWCCDLAASRLQCSRIGNGDRQFVGEQHVVGLIAHGAGWRESVSLSVECLLQWQSSSPDKEQQQAYCHLPPHHPNQHCSALPLFN